MASKPTVLVVHGAWHEPQPAYEPLKLQIESLGYECYMPKLPTAGGDEIRGVTWEADVQAILEVALPLFDQGKEVVLVAHSYGGVPSCIATQGLGVQERAAKGKSGGFRQIIFIAAFAIPAKGMDVLATFGGNWPGWADFAEPYTKNHAIKLGEEARDSVYGGVTEAEVQKYWSGVKLHSQDAFELPVPFSASDITIPKSYMVCTKDTCVPGPLQEHLAQSLGFKIERIESGHMPFLSNPDQCRDTLKEMII